MVVQQGYYRSPYANLPSEGLPLEILNDNEAQQWLPWETVYDRQKTVLQEYLDAARYPSAKPVLPAPAIKMTAATASSSSDSA